MTTFSVKIESAPAQRALDAMGQVPADRLLMMELSAYLVQTSRARFADETAPDGKPWLPLQPRTLANKRTTAILRETTLLQLSLREDYGDDYAGVAAGGPGVPYAAIHQLGGTPEMPAGPRDVPARPYLGVSDDDAEELAGIVGDYLDALASAVT